MYFPSYVLHVVDDYQSFSFFLPTGPSIHVENSAHFTRMHYLYHLHSTQTTAAFSRLERTFSKMHKIPQNLILVMEKYTPTMNLIIHSVNFW